MIARIAPVVRAKQQQVAAAIALFDAGNTLPFVARYRKEATGGLDEVQLAAIVEQLMTHRDKVMTVSPDDPARKAATLMVKHHFDRVPVIDEDDTLLGLVTRHDIMKLVGL